MELFKWRNKQLVLIITLYLWFNLNINGQYVKNDDNQIARNSSDSKEFNTIDGDISTKKKLIELLTENRDDLLNKFKLTTTTIPKASCINVADGLNNLILLHCDNVTLDLVNNFMQTNGKGYLSKAAASEVDDPMSITSLRSSSRSSSPAVLYENGQPRNRADSENDNIQFGYKAIILSHVNYAPEQSINSFRWPFVSQPNNENLNRQLFAWNENTTEYLSWINSELRSDQITNIIRSKNRIFLKLNYLDLSFNHIRELTRQMFEKLPNLLTLNLSNNAIEFELIEANVFKNVAQLRRLDLSNNNIMDLPRNTFDGLRNLRYLNLANNKLSIIPFQAFHTLEVIEHLDLSHNRLISFLDNYFIDNRQLRVLLLQNNSIEHLSGNSLFGLKLLKYLDISGNQLLALESHAFSSLASLEVLDLSKNNVSLVSVILFNELYQLKYLNLSKNKFRMLPTGILASQINLEELIIDETAVLRLGNLVSKKDNVVDKSVLANLRKLSIKNNKDLRDIKPVLFQNVPAIQVLILSGNRLNLLPHEISELTELKHLDVSNNDLISIPKEITALAHLRSLSLLGNNYTCDCHMVWLIDWIANLQNRMNSNASLEIHSRSPAPLNQLSSLRCRHGYPGDFLRVIQQLHCHAPVVVRTSENTTHLLRSEVQLECIFSGYPTPDIIWITPLNKIIRYHADPDIRPLVSTDVTQHSNDSHSFAESRHHIKNREKMEHHMFQGTLPVFSIPKELDGITLLDNGSLRIHNVMREDAGLYSCYGYNIMGHANADIRLVYVNPNCLLGTKFKKINTVNNNMYFHSFQIFHRPNCNLSH